MSSAPLPPHSPLERYYRRDASKPHDDRRAFVTELFDKTAPHYERINRILSFGWGLKYRQDALERAGLRPGMRVLDVGVGTGLTARAALSATDRSASVIGLDPSLGMLHEARSLEIALVRALAERLPMATASFDFLTMGYALRHVADLKATFQEYLRVLRPGGRLLILEMTRPSGSGLRSALTRWYLKRAMPFLAEIGSGGSDARELMEYYWDTIESCVLPEVVLTALGEAGFEQVERHHFWNTFIEYVASRTTASSFAPLELGTLTNSVI